MKPTGYATITDPDGMRECDTHTCAHCQRIVHVAAGKNFEDIADFCRSCMQVICARCAERRECTPFLKMLERWEARQAVRRSYDG